MIRRRHLLLGAAAFGTVRTARAARTLTLIAGGKPGALVAREAQAFIPLLARHLPDTSIQLKLVPGDAGLVALHALEQAPADGSVLGFVATPTLPARMVDRGASELLQQIRLLGAVEKEPIAIVSPSATPLSSVQDIIAQAADDAAAVPLGTPPPGSPPHLAALRLQALADTRLNIVAFPSAAAACQAAVAGNVAAAALALSSAIGDLRNGKLAGLGIASENRTDVFPDMPPLLDSGIDLSAAIWRGLAAPAGIADDVVEPLVRAMKALVEDDDFRQLANSAGFIATWLDGASWTDEAHNERARLNDLWATEPWLQEGSG